MDGLEVWVLQEAGQGELCSFLQSHDSMHLEVHVIPSYVLGYFVDCSCEGVLAYEELCTCLVLPDLAEGYCSKLVLPEPLYKSSLQKLSRDLSSNGCLIFFCTDSWPMVLTVPPLPPVAPAARLGMIWAISPPPPAFLLPASSCPTPPVREEYQEPVPPHACFLIFT